MSERRDRRSRWRDRPSWVPAGPSDVLASQTVRDLTAGSGIGFEDAGEHELKGVPDRWRVHRVTSTA